MGGSTPEARPSAQDIALVDRAVRDQNLADAIFHPLEQKAVREATDPQTLALETLRTKGTANADIAQAVGKAQGREGTDRSSEHRGSRIRDFEIASGSAHASGQVDAGVEALLRQDERQLNAARTGLDQQRSTIGNLSESANRATSRALTRVKGQSLKRQATVGGIGELLGAGTAIATDDEARQTLRSRFGSSASKTSVNAKGG